MTDHLAIMDSAAPSFSLERAARSYHEERIPLSPPLPDRDWRWRWAVAMLAAILLHIGVVTTIDDGFQRPKPIEKTPVPVEIVTEPPAPPPPPEKPVEKPVEKPIEKPPAPAQQPEPDRSSGGDLADKALGALPPAPAAEEKPPTPASPAAPVSPEPPTPTPTATPPIAEPPAPVAAPSVPTEATPQAVPLPPAASTPRTTQQAVVPPPVPLRKPAAPPVRQVTTAAPPQPESQTPPTSSLQDLRIGEGGGDKYLNAMKKKIIDHFHYPPTAEMFHITGTAVYKVQIDRQGQLMGMLVYLSTNSELLDDAGLKAIEMAAPFGPLPADFAVGASSIVLEVTVPME